MNATNRLVNRGVLLLIGAGLLVVGAFALAVGARPSWAGDALAVAVRTSRDLRTRIDEVSVPLLGGEIDGPVLVLAVLGLLVAIAAVAFVLTRGGGRTADVVRIAGDGGRTAVDRSVADAVIAGALGGRPDVLSARTAAYRVRHQPAVSVTLSVRKGAPLAAVLAAAERAVGEWDVLAGERTPVMIHIADPRWRDALRSRSRVR